MTTPIIKLRSTGKCFIWLRNENCLLDALEIQEIKIEYQCRAGYCGSCRLKLIKGLVTYYRKPALALINDSEILPCHCMPLTDIEIDI